MGLHAFAKEPQHCQLYRALMGPRLPTLPGFAERWTVPLMRHRNALGDGATFPGVDH